MTLKLLLITVTGGITLLGAVLFSPKENINYLPAAINQTEDQESKVTETVTQLPVSTPKIIYITVTPITKVSTPENSPPTQTSILNQNTSTPLAPAQSPANSADAASQNKSSHIFYTSSHWKSKYYYCDTDDDWKKLSATYLKSFNSERELLKNYNRVLHKPCID